MSKRGTPSGGEPIDRTAGEAIRLAHRALERFPEIVKRHKFVAGGAVVSSSLIALAGVAISRRIHNGQTPEEAVATVTEEEVQGLRIVEPEPLVDMPEGDVASLDGDAAPSEDARATEDDAAATDDEAARRPA